MKYLGKRGDYLYYQRNKPYRYMGILPEIQGKYFICGGAALNVLHPKFNTKDIDVWTSGDIPKEARRESPYAFNHIHWANGLLESTLPMQFMKVHAQTPTEVLDKFDMDCAKAALYNLTDSGYNVVIHKFLQPLVYHKPISGLSGVNPKSFNEMSLGRMTKYAKKFGIPLFELFSVEDYTQAIRSSGLDIDLSRHSNSAIQMVIQEFCDKHPEDYEYELLEHLQDLFHHTRRSHVIRYDDYRGISTRAERFQQSFYEPRDRTFPSYRYN